MKGKTRQDKKREKEITKIPLVSVLFIVTVFLFPLLKPPNISLLERESLGFRAVEGKTYTFEELMYYGNLYLRAGDFDTAIDRYTKAIELNPNSYEAYYFRGVAYFRMKNEEKAIEDLQKALELNPGDSTIKGALVMVKSRRRG